MATTGSERPNYFGLLELDPHRQHSCEEIKIAVERARSKWQSRQNHPDRGVQAQVKSYLSLVGNIEQTLCDPKLQAQEREALNRIRDSETRKLRDRFSESMNLFKNQEINTHTFRRLSNEYKELYSSENALKAELKRFAITVEPAAPTWPKPLDANIWIKIEELLNLLEAQKGDARLKELGITLGAEKLDLYKVLGVPPTSTNEKIVARCNELAQATREKANQREKVDEIVAELAPLAKTWLGSERRQQYDETLRRQQKRLLTIDEDLKSYSNEKVIGTEGTKAVIEKAQRRGLSLNEIKEYLRVLNVERKDKGPHITIPSDHMLQTINLIKCPICNGNNEDTAFNCAECGHELIWTCPNCRTEVKLGRSRCACGFDKTRSQEVLKLLNDGSKALEERQYAEAIKSLDAAKANWTFSQEHDFYSAQITKLRAEAKELSTRYTKLIDAISHDIEKRRLKSAKSNLESNRDLLSDGEFKSRLQALQKEIVKADQLVSSGKQHMRTGQYDAAYNDFNLALESCRDHEEASDLKKQVPPMPPGTLTAKLDVNRQTVELSWIPTSSVDSNYVVQRQGIAFTEETTATQFTQKSVPVGVELRYSVFSVRNGVKSKKSSTHSNVLICTADVSQLKALPDDRAVTLKWDPPPNTTRITVERRISDSRPSKFVTLHQLPGSADSYKDTLVQNGTSYTYRVVAEFGDDHLRSQGVTVTDVTPDSPPTFSRDTQLTVIDKDLHLVQLQWAPPDKGEIKIIASKHPLPIPPGGRSSLSEILGHGKEIKLDRQSRDTCKIEVKVTDNGPTVFSTIVALNQTAYIGNSVTYVAVEEVSNLSWRIAGNSLEVTWDWPPECEQVHIRYSFHGDPDRDIDAGWIPIKRNPRTTRGFFSLDDWQQHAYVKLRVSTIFGDHVSHGKDLVADSRKLLSYVLARRRLRGGWQIKVVFDKRVESHTQDLPTLGVYYSHERFTRPEDGQLWFDLPVDLCRSGKDFNYSLPNRSQDMGKGPIYIRVFAADSTGSSHDVVVHPQDTSIHL